MPATAGRVRMPQNNRVAVSSTLRTHAIWANSVGYDPYAPETQDSGADAALKEKAKELLTLARLTGTVSTHTPGACSKCNQVGHLAYQCRNDVTFVKDKERAQATESLLRQKEMESDDEKLRKALGIGSDDEAKPTREKRRRWSSPSTDGSESDSSDSSDGRSKKKKHRKHKKKKQKKHKKSVYPNIR